MSVIAAINEAAFTEIVTGSVRWKVRRVNTALLQAAGRAGLAMIPHDGPAMDAVAAIVQAGVTGAAPDPAAKVKLAEALIERMRRATPEDLAAQANERGAVVSAGVVMAAKAEPAPEEAEPTWTPWEPIKVVLNGTPSDPERGLLHIDDLPHEWVEALHAGILAHTNDGSGAAKRIASFRG